MESKEGGHAPPKHIGISTPPQDPNISALNGSIISSSQIPFTSKPRELVDELQRGKGMRSVRPRFDEIESVDVRRL